jgi:hypothetical protein
MTLRALFVVILSLAAVPSAGAQQQQRAAPAAPTELGTFGGWRAFSHQDQRGTQCYVLGTPQSSEPRDIQPGTNRRDATNLFITNRPGQNVRNEISIVIGYVFRPNSNATIEVLSQSGTRRFTLFTRERGAWLQNAAEEQQLVQAMRGGRELVVRGTSQRGTNTVDRYALANVSAALDRIGQCR